MEIVSDTSVIKDTRRLPEAYFKAGVAEFWLVDARRSPLVFQIHVPGRSGYQAVKPDAEDFQASAVLSARFLLEGKRDAQNHWAFDLIRR